MARKRIDKGKRRGGVGQGGHKHGTVDIGRDDMRRLREVAGAAYDIVAAVEHLGDISHAVGAGGTQLYMVANGDGVGGAYALDAEIALDQALDFRAVVAPHYIARPCISYNRGTHFIICADGQWNCSDSVTRLIVRSLQPRRQTDFKLAHPLNIFSSPLE